ncbi:hypothetical protein AYI69_g9480, partial [Smittium culicis]
LSALEKSNQALSEFIMQNSNSPFSNPIRANSTSMSFDSITSNYNTSTSQNLSISKNSSKSFLSSDIDYTFENIGKVSLSNDTLAQDKSPVLNNNTHKSSPGLNISPLENNIPYTFENIVINTTQSPRTDCSEADSPVMFTSNSKDKIFNDDDNTIKSDLKLEQEKSTLQTIDNDSLPAPSMTTRLESNNLSLYTFQSILSSSENIKTNKSQSFDISRTNNDSSLKSFNEKISISSPDIRINVDSNSETNKFPLSPFKAPVESKVISNSDKIDSRQPDFIFPQSSGFNEHKENDISSVNVIDTSFVSKVSAINHLENNDCQATDTLLNPLPLDVSTPNAENQDQVSKVDDIDHLADRSKEIYTDSSADRPKKAESKNEAQAYNQVDVLIQQETNSDNQSIDELEDYVMKDGEINETEIEKVILSQQETIVQTLKSSEADIEDGEIIETQKKSEIEAEKANIIEVSGADLESYPVTSKNVTCLIIKKEINISKECTTINSGLNFVESIPVNKKKLSNQEVISIEEDDNISSQTSESSSPHRYKTRFATKIKNLENSKKTKSKRSENTKHNSLDNGLRPKKNKRGRPRKINVIDLISSDHEIQADIVLENNKHALESPSLKDVLSNSSDNCALSAITSNIE